MRGYECRQRHVALSAMLVRCAFCLLTTLLAGRAGNQPLSPGSDDRFGDLNYRIDGFSYDEVIEKIQSRCSLSACESKYPPKPSNAAVDNRFHLIDFELRVPALCQTTAASAPGGPAAQGDGRCAAPRSRVGILNYELRDTGREQRVGSHGVGGERYELCVVD
eukprot:6202957-Pleurochrysis_carterae.AAC.1